MEPQIHMNQVSPFAAMVLTAQTPTTRNTAPIAVGTARLRRETIKTSLSSWRGMGGSNEGFSG